MSENMIYCANGICYSMNSKCHYSLNSIFFKIIFAKAKIIHYIITKSSPSFSNNGSRNTEGLSCFFRQIEYHF